MATVVQKKNVPGISKFIQFAENNVKQMYF